VTPVERGLWMLGTWAVVAVLWYIVRSNIQMVIIHRDVRAETTHQTPHIRALHFYPTVWKKYEVWRSGLDGHISCPPLIITSLLWPVTTIVWVAILLLVVLTLVFENTFPIIESGAEAVRRKVLVSPETISASLKENPAKEVPTGEKSGGLSEVGDNSGGLSEVEDKSGSLSQIQSDSDWY
jgi:hypothetical protein